MVAKCPFHFELVIQTKPNLNISLLSLLVKKNYTFSYRWRLAHCTTRFVAWYLWLDQFFFNQSRLVDQFSEPINLGHWLLYRNGSFVKSSGLLSQFFEQVDWNLKFYNFKTNMYLLFTWHDYMRFLASLATFSYKDSLDCLSQLRRSFLLLLGPQFVRWLSSTRPSLL